MLELFGSGYAIEYCVAALTSYNRQKNVEYYIADCVKNTNEILATRFGGAYLKDSLRDILEPVKKETRTGEEIAADIIKKAGLKIGVQHGFNDIGGKADP